MERRQKAPWPQGFFFGAATSAHQVEGGNRNDWSEWERENAARLAREAASRYGNLPNWPDIRDRAENPMNYVSGDACDHYNRYEEDLDIARSLGHNAHRFSIEWSRVEPEEGRFNEAEIEHYRKVVAACRARGLEPFVTLWHWTLPPWLRDRGGVLARRFPEYFARYAERVAQAIGADVTYWMTLNEPTSVIGSAYAGSAWPPQMKSLFAAYRAYGALASAHRRAYHAIHSAHPAVQVGFGNIMNDIVPDREGSLLDQISVRISRYWTNTRFLDLTAGTNDYLALQYYFHSRVRFPWRVMPENDKRTDMGWAVHQEGMFDLLKDLAAYKRPIFITENGLADARDAMRAEFIRDALAAVRRALDHGIDVRGYFHWSLLDNFEWDKGFWPKFGLVAVNYATQERAVRPSAWEYKKMIENGIPPRTS